MEENTNSRVVYSQNVLEFVRVAAEYATFVENVHRFSKKDVLDKLHTLMALLYLKGTLLPKIDSNFEEANEQFVSEEEWQLIHDNIKTKLGYHDEYPELTDPTSHEAVEPSIASIADNIADVYQDIKNFLSAYNMGNEEIMNDAIWECQMNFEEFWGQKLLNALKAIHPVYYGEDDLEEEEENQNIEGWNEDNFEDIDTSNWILSKRQAAYKKERPDDEE